MCISIKKGQKSRDTVPLPISTVGIAVLKTKEAFTTAVALSLYNDRDTVFFHDQNVSFYHDSDNGDTVPLPRPWQPWHCPFTTTLTTVTLFPYQDRDNSYIVPLSLLWQPWHCSFTTTVTTVTLFLYHDCDNLDTVLLPRSWQQWHYSFTTTVTTVTLPIYHDSDNRDTVVTVPLPRPWPLQPDESLNVPTSERTAFL